MHRAEDISGSGCDIHIDGISKTEGHSSLDIKMNGSRVENVRLQITESKRFYTQAIRGKAAISLPLATSRICGTCSIAHLSCCAEAIERAINYEPSEQTILLRKLATYGMMIRDHALHLFIFCLPDLFGKDSVMEFEGADEELIRKAFAVKAAGNNMSKVVAGRAVHATFAEVGRFSHVPEKEDVRNVVRELSSVRDAALEFIDIFHGSALSFERDTGFISLITDDYSFVRNRSRIGALQEDEYLEHLKRVVIPYSEAVGYSFKGSEFMVGALARMNRNKNSLHRDTRRDAAKYLKAFPSKNIFHNNLAQAIEILHCIDHSIELLESSDFKEEGHAPLTIREGTGIGVLEAPRGTLYYLISVDKLGRASNGSIIVPTQQNQIGMEKAVGEYVEANAGRSRSEIVNGIEMLIRAYDPCMSCASHFLKVKWR